MPELKRNRHLKPGVGHIEHVEIDLEPRCDDDTLSRKGEALEHWYAYLFDATRRHERSIAYDHDSPRHLEEWGFVDVQHTKIRIPIGEWGQDWREHEIGRWYRVSLCEAVEALSLAPFTRPSYNWPIADVKRYLSEVETIVQRADIHAYHEL